MKCDAKVTTEEGFRVKSHKCPNQAKFAVTDKVSSRPVTTNVCGIHAERYRKWGKLYTITPLGERA